MPYLQIYSLYFKMRIVILFQGSRDNMSIVLVTFPGAPKPNPDAKKKEAELDMFIERIIKGSVSYPYLFSILSLCCCLNSRRSRSRKRERT